MAAPYTFILLLTIRQSKRYKQQSVMGSCSGNQLLGLHVYGYKALQLNRKG
jgi:hypothetical protein